MNRAARVVMTMIVAVGLVASLSCGQSPAPAESAGSAASSGPTVASKLPRLVDLGAKSCIPCKKMAPILEELKKELAGKLEVEFIDVSIKENLPQSEKFAIKLIPTQVFLAADGKELWRHEGFFSKEEILAKWKELGYTFATVAPAAAAAYERLEPAQADSRARSSLCYMCEKSLNPRTAVTVRTAKGEVKLCGPHCYFIMYSSLTEDKSGFEKKVAMTDYATGQATAALEAVYLYGLDEKSGRPWIKTYADRAAAEKERAGAGGSLIGWATLQDQELSYRCGFCDRAVYPQDAALVKAGGLQTWGCCSHCAMGVAARTGQDIEVRQPDALTGEMIVIRTAAGNVTVLEPVTAVAWFGQRKAADGQWVSAGCFHQGFFATEANLRKWVEQHPAETGRQISIQKVLADKMQLSPQQIQKACKIGECAPKP